MRVEKIMTPEVRTCHEHDTMDVAVKTMWEGDCGIVPVLDAQDHLVGVITDRDACMAAWTRGLPLNAMRVHEAMSRSLQTCSPRDTIETAEDCMREHRIRRLPVVDSGRLVGIVSLADVARTASSQPRTVESDRLVGTLAAIGEPHLSAPQSRAAAATAS